MQRWTKERKSRCGYLAKKRKDGNGGTPTPASPARGGARERGNAKIHVSRDGHALPRSRDPAVPRSRDLTHVDDHGRARMVDVSNKPATVRQAVARGEVRMTPQTLAKIKANAIAKGDVLAVARVAGVMAAKRTDELIPLAHPLALTGIDVTFSLKEETNTVEIVAGTRNPGRPPRRKGGGGAGVGAALPIYDICEAADRG